MTLPTPRLHPDPAPRMVTGFCRRAELGDPAAPCMCGLCDRSGGADPFAPTVRPNILTWPAWLAFAALVMAVAGVRGIVRAARHTLCGALYAAADAVNPSPPLPDDRHDALVRRIMDSTVGRERGGAT